MIAIILKGGLGNQMFQKAFGRYLSYSYDIPLFLDRATYLSGNTNRLYNLDIFGSDNTEVGDILEIFYSSFSEYFLINERFFLYDDDLIKRLDTMLKEKKNKKVLYVVNGYWQSYKYFAPIENLVKENFIPRRQVSGRFLKPLHLIKETESVMLNVRRGDYLQKLDYHGVVSKEYIEKSMAIMKTYHSNAYFFVFSDDIPWCRQNIAERQNILFLDESFYDLKYENYFMLMRSCKHFIISNSTFCWWAAWLSENPDKKVIAPKEWFVTDKLDTRDLIPSSWLCI